MSVADWIATHSAGQPERLAARIRRAVISAESAVGLPNVASGNASVASGDATVARGDASVASGVATVAPSSGSVASGESGDSSGHTRVASSAELLIGASAATLTEVLRSGRSDRASALDLLAADALATYAFEAQADAPEQLDARCTWAMGVLSRIAETA